MGEAYWDQGLGELHPEDLLPQSASAVGSGGGNSVDSGGTEGSPVKSGVSKQNQFCKIEGKKSTSYKQ